MLLLMLKKKILFWIWFCNLIDEQGLANVRELKRFINQHGGEYGIPSMKIVNEVIRSHTGLVGCTLMVFIKNGNMVRV